MSPQRVLILSVSAGAGHTRTSEALRKAYGETNPQIDVIHADTLEYTPAAFRETYRGGYLKMVNTAPALWGYLYERLDEAKRDGTRAKLRTFLDRLNTRPLLKFIANFRPDHIIATHFLPAEVLSKFRSREADIAWTLSVVLTDFDVHALWMYEDIDMYFAPSDEVAHVCRKRLNRPGGVVTTGIPIDPAFAAPMDRGAIRAKLGLPGESARRPTILISSGGFGIGGVTEMVRAVAAIGKPMDLLVVAGKNEKLKEELAGITPPPGVGYKTFGFVNNMHELMAASDVMVTKSGGLTTSECLAIGLPMLVISPIPGQEERNADYLMEHGAALKANSVYALEFKLNQLLAEPARLSAMAQAAKAIGRPRAAFDVGQRVLNLQRGAHARHASQ